MEEKIEYVRNSLDARMRVTPKGFPYWYGRDVMEILGYENWENFLNGKRPNWPATTRGDRLPTISLVSGKWSALEVEQREKEKTSH
jgi:16S rRNA C967 or C1407 C5-methylase (RsmB/RsmF family)